MLSPREVEELIAQARRNEEIQRRLDAVEDFLMATSDLGGLLAELVPRLARIYQLEAVSLALCRDHPRLSAALGGEAEMPPGAFWRTRPELRIWLADLERPLLSHDLRPEFLQCFFPGSEGLGSVALAPLWARGELLGVLGLGSASSTRYHPSYATHFLSRLGRKVALGLTAALAAAEVRRMERRQAAVAMAGAACHGLAQPLTTVGLLLERLRRAGSDPAGRDEALEAMEAELARVSELVQKISKVGSYVTKPYAQGMNIVDLEAADPKPAKER